jgi:hypothetical protein
VHTYIYIIYFFNFFFSFWLYLKTLSIQWYHPLRGTSENVSLYVLNCWPCNAKEKKKGGEVKCRLSSSSISVLTSTYSQRKKEGKKDK